VTDATARPVASLIVSTLGRGETIIALLESLRRQTFRDFEVIIVNQNDDERLATLLADRDFGFALHHLRSPGERGLSRGRNRGWRASTGSLILFPDDDCWYPADFLERIVAEMSLAGADVMSGRAADEHGRSINGRYCESKAVIDKANVWTTQIEWVVMFRRYVLEKVGGYDENVGVGAFSAWQSGEGQDIMLRALAEGYKCMFDPTIVGHHAELNITQPDHAMCKKGRSYGRGMGHVLRKHQFGWAEKMRWSLRPLAGAILYLPRNIKRSYYYFAVFLGRLEGIFGITI
jgi:glycosyltransferase involved in cell wall biosynthesis